DRAWLQPGSWRGPALLAGVLLVELLWVLATGEGVETGHVVSSKEVGIRLFGPYVLAVELASMLLLAGLVGAYHLSRREPQA
ncbi:MAG: NADH-quinone oxidoreductase subunit J, partial [Gammaproteobacteria bacterium]|nr:NADH-quinone oxidoreductase subunit J [Gammaproteobacteria bacterium]